MGSHGEWENIARFFASLSRLIQHYRACVAQVQWAIWRVRVRWRAFRTADRTVPWDSVLRGILREDSRVPQKLIRLPASFPICACAHRVFRALQVYHRAWRSSFPRESSIRVREWVLRGEIPRTQKRDSRCRVIESQGSFRRSSSPCVRRHQRNILSEFRRVPETEKRRTGSQKYPASRVSSADRRSW